MHTGLNMSQLDPNRAEYQQAAENIVYLETAKQEYAQEVGNVTEKQKSLTEQFIGSVLTPSLLLKLSRRKTKEQI